MCKYPLYIVCLFDFDTDANRVDGRFDQHLFVLIAGDAHWIQNDLRGRPYVRIPDKEGDKRESYFASISGMLCRSTTWLEKFSRHNAAVRLARTQFRYGRNVLDYELVTIKVERGKVDRGCYHFS